MFSCSREEFDKKYNYELKPGIFFYYTFRILMNEKFDKKRDQLLACLANAGVFIPDTIMKFHGSDSPCRLKFDEEL